MTIVNPLRLLIVDQQRLFCEALMGLLQQEPWLEIVAAGGPMDVLPALCSGNWDVLLGDPCHKDSAFLFATAVEFGDKGIVALTEGEDPLLLEGFFRAGLRPVLPKRVRLKELLRTLQRVSAA